MDFGCAFGLRNSAKLLVLWQLKVLCPCTPKPVSQANGSIWPDFLGKGILHNCLLSEKKTLLKKILGGIVECWVFVKPYREEMDVVCVKACREAVCAKLFAAFSIKGRLSRNLSAKGCM